MAALETVGFRGWCWTYREKPKCQKTLVAN